MNIVINIDDIWTDGEKLTTEITQTITDSVVRVVMEKTKQQVDQIILKKTKDIIEERIGSEIDKAIKSSLDNIKLRKRSGGIEEVEIDEYIKDFILTTNGWNNVPDQLAKIAKNHIEEFKKRYDMQFASQIVSKLAEQKLLKEDAVKTLLQS